METFSQVMDGDGKVNLTPNRQVFLGDRDITEHVVGVDCGRPGASATVVGTFGTYHRDQSMKLAYWWVSRDRVINEVFIRQAPTTQLRRWLKLELPVDLKNKLYAELLGRRQTRNGRR